MLRDLLKTLENIMYVERFSATGGIAQGVDPRVKLCSFVAFILAAVAVRTVTPLIILFLIITGLAVVSGIPLRFFLLRATLFIPMFAAVIALPLPFITPGTPLATIGYGGFFISITEEGLYRAAQFTLRVWVCVASLVLLALTTRFSRLVQSLERLKAPRVFVMMIAVTYRFIFLFIDEAYRMALAREARRVGMERRMQTMKSLANMLSTLFIRAYERGERVYLAMVARGYTGEAKSMVKMRCTQRDWFFGAACVLTSLAVLSMELLSLGGV
ncbi:MAG: cobalt ECF transporter T component CbiQ [Candidatus Geothermarchaeales archaeon]